MSAPMDNTIDGITKSIFERNHGNMVLIEDLNRLDDGQEEIMEGTK